MQKKLTIASHLMCWNTEYIPRRSETRAGCLLSTTSIQHCSECEWEIRLTDSCVWTLSPQLGMLFGGSYGTFWRWSLPGRSASLRVRFEGSPTSCSSYLLPLYRWNVISLLPASVAMLSPLLWTLSLWSHKLK